MDLDLKVMNALKETEETFDVKDKLRIRKGAYKKAMLIAKIVERVAGGCMECYGYLLKDKDGLDDTVTAIYLADDQDAQSAYVRVTDEGVRKAATLIEPMGYEIAGWWHSHGTMQTFHSGTDVRNFHRILHSIAPRTMYRTEEALFRMDGGSLHVDNYRLDNVQAVPGSGIRILKKVERDPFALSMVVNVREDTYRECIKKVYDAEAKQFVVQEPTHPELDLVDDDIQLDVADLEWQVYEKIAMQGKPWEANYLSSGKDIPSGPVVKKFFDSAVSYISDDGKYSALLGEMLLTDNKEVLGSGLAEGKLGADQKDIEQMIEDSDELVKGLDSMFEGSDIGRISRNNHKLSKSELGKQQYFMFMMKFALAQEKDQAAGSTEHQDKVIEEYRHRVAVLEESAAIAERAIKTLSRYAMSDLTDYNGKFEHKYAGLMSNILSNLSTRKSYEFLKSVQKETEHVTPSSVRKQLLLLPDRVHVFNQLAYDVYRIKMRDQPGEDHQKVLDFLVGVADKYTSAPGEIDGLIESHILPLRLPDEEYERRREAAMVKTLKEEIASQPVYKPPVRPAYKVNDRRKIRRKTIWGYARDLVPEFLKGGWG